MGNPEHCQVQSDENVTKKDDPLLPFIQQPENLPDYLKHVPNDILTKGYAIIPSLLTDEECQQGLDLMWDFVQDTSGNVVQKDDFQTWYPKNQLKRKETDEGENGGSADSSSLSSMCNFDENEDPWPHTGYSSFPDMFQSLGAGFLLGPTREIMAERVFSPLLGTNELHSSKEGFTFARPTKISIDQVEDGIGGKTKNTFIWCRSKRMTEVKVCGKTQSESLGEHYDQAHDTKGLHTIQSSVCFLDQNEECNDGHFVCYPNSHSSVHESITKEIYRGRFSWVPLTTDEVRSLDDNMDIRPLHIYAKAGDVILWRSDLIHGAVPPGDETENFRAVGYFSMNPACWTPSFPGVWKEKMDSYRQFKTGDHRSFVESWHDHKRSQGSSSSSPSEEQWIVLRQRPYYRYCPPRISKRLAELYGLMPYRISDDEYEKEIERSIIRGVRFINSEDDGKFTTTNLDLRSAPNTPLCTARTQALTLSDGALLPGQDKYLGGMCSPCGTYIYGVPGHAKRVLCINTKTNEMDFIGPSYSGQFKFLRGLEVPPDAMGDKVHEFPSGCCLALPSNASKVLKINCATNEVTTFGDIEEKGWLYHGGNLAADGYVYAIPANATRVLKIDPRNDTIELIGPSFPGRQKWFGGIMGCDGCIYGIAQNSSGVL